jgi:hypothetical protein
MIEGDIRLCDLSDGGVSASHGLFCVLSTPYLVLQSVDKSLHNSRKSHHEINLILYHIDELTTIIAGIISPAGEWM